MMSATDDAPIRRRIALIAHDNKKEDLRDWAAFNRSLLAAPHPPPLPPSLGHGNHRPPAR